MLFIALSTNYTSGGANIITTELYPFIILMPVCKLGLFACSFSHKTSFVIDFLMHYHIRRCTRC